MNKLDRETCVLCNVWVVIMYVNRRESYCVNVALPLRNVSGTCTHYTGQCGRLCGVFLGFIWNFSAQTDGKMYLPIA